jgi:hypothetical protein
MTAVLISVILISLMVNAVTIRHFVRSPRLFPDEAAWMEQGADGRKRGTTQQIYDAFNAGTPRDSLRRCRHQQWRLSDVAQAIECLDEHFETTPKTFWNSERTTSSTVLGPNDGIGR